MEKILNKQNWVILTILISLLLIIGLTIYKINAIHLERSFLVVEKKFIEGAKECVWDGVCTEDKILLGDLIKEGYVKDEVNPQTKRYYSHDSYVLKADNEYSFVEVK